MVYKKSKLFTIHLLLAFFGYPIFAVFSDVFNSGLLTIFYRFTVFSLSIFFIVGTLIEKRITIKNADFICSIVLIIFLLIMFFRAQIYLWGQGYNPGMVIRHYTWGFLAELFFPVLSMFYLCNVEIDEKIVRRFIIVAFILVIPYALFYGFQYMKTEQLYGLRVGLPRLNPISLAHYIVSALAFSLALIHGKSGFFYKVFFFVISFLFMLPTGTRQTILISIAILLFVLFFYKKSLVVVFLVLSLTVISFTLLNADQGLIIHEDLKQFTDRLTSQDSGSESSSSGRMLAFKNAWHIFADNPLFGGALEEQTLKKYPHNILLEIVMISGIVPLIMFLSVISRCLYKAFCFNHYPLFGKFIILTFLQYLIGGMFSSSVYTPNPFFLSCIVVLILGKRVPVCEQPLIVHK
jgi:O-antigen ligase